MIPVEVESYVWRSAAIVPSCDCSSQMTVRTLRSSFGWSRRGCGPVTISRPLRGVRLLFLGIQPPARRRVGIRAVWVPNRRLTPLLALSLSLCCRRRSFSSLVRRRADRFRGLRDLLGVLNRSLPHGPRAHATEALFLQEFLQLLLQQPRVLACHASLSDDSTSDM